MYFSFRCVQVCSGTHINGVALYVSFPLDTFIVLKLQDVSVFVTKEQWNLQCFISQVSHKSTASNKNLLKETHFKSIQFWILNNFSTYYFTVSLHFCKVSHKSAITKHDNNWTWFELNINISHHPLFKVSRESTEKKINQVKAKPFKSYQVNLSTCCKPLPLLANQL